jgi:hypothetical protein
VRPTPYHVYGFRDPDLPAALPAGFSVFPCRTRRAWFKTPADPLSVFGPFQESSSAKPSCSPDHEDPATQHLSWAFLPYSTCGQRGPLPDRPLTGRLRGFCLPASFRPQGLVTLSTVYSPADLADSVSHRQRSWDFPFGAFSSRKVSGSFPPGSTHVPFLPTLFPTAEAAGRPVEPRFLGFGPCENPLATNAV